MRGLKRHSIRLSCALFIATTGFCATTGGLRAQDQKIFQMVHTGWTARDGAPQNVNTLAQTADGMLWLGTRAGLYTFDGLTFSLFQPVSGFMPTKNVQSLFATKDGDLWAIGRNVHAIRIRDGVATQFDRVENGSFVSLHYVQQSSDKTVWAILNQQKLVRLKSDGLWQVVAGARPDCQQIGSFFIDSSDTQWLVADNLLYRRPRGQQTFTSTQIPIYGPAKFEEAKDRTIWIAGYAPIGVRPKQPPGQPAEFGLKHVDPSGKRLENPFTNNDVSDVAAGADGTLWVSHIEGGLQRLRTWEMSGSASKGGADSPDTFDVADGLTTTGYRAMLRDRDGNIWSAGGRGLDRFKFATIVPAVPNAINGLWSFCIAPDGDVWLSLFDGFFAVIRGHRLIRLKDHRSTGSLLCSNNDGVLLRDDFGLAKVHSDRVEKLPLLPGHGNYIDRYYFATMLVLPDHRLLASTAGATENGLWTYENKTWKPFLPSSEIARIGALWQDTHNYLYLGSADGIIIVLQPPSFVVISKETLSIGAVSGFSQTRYGIYAFGENGVALQQNGRFHMLSFANPELAATVTGLVEDRKGDIWINGTHAIACISSAEMSAAVLNPSHHILAREFREGEFRGSDIPTALRNSAQIDLQGRIWFATANGVVYIDPQHINLPSHPPILSIRSISADGRALNSNRAFQPGVQTLSVHYFGLNLANPAGVVYRYRLQNSDAGWQDAGHRTEAIYTHLPPHRYAFQVMASNGDGAWTEPVDSAPFTILPAFYQTWWFKALAVVSGILLLWVGLNARVSYATRAIRMRAEERATERVRIARELHDTLLQGVQGLLLSFHVAAEKVPELHESKQALEKALAMADRIILEGRNRVSRLRSRLTSDDFEPSILALAQDLNSMCAVEFAIESNGTCEPLNPDILEDVFYIAREALTNSFRHSYALRIVVTLDYGKRQFSMECRDNGRGFDACEVLAAESNGHWGLRGMAERAARIGARFTYESAPGDGTRVGLVLPARRAYLREHSFPMLFRFRRVKHGHTADA